MDAVAAGPLGLVERCIGRLDEPPDDLAIAEPHGRDPQTGGQYTAWHSRMDNPFGFDGPPQPFGQHHRPAQIGPRQDQQELLAAEPEGPVVVVAQRAAQLPAAPPKGFVPGPEARRLLGEISARKMAQMVAAGEVPSVRIGRRRLFPLDGLRAYVAARVEGGK